MKAYDALGRETRFGFGDNFGAPNGEARTNTAPAELAGLPQATRAYAFPTKVVNSAGHVGHTQYDYYLGHAVEGEDANGVLTLLRYDDPPDHLTRGVRAYDRAEQSQTTMAYNDAGRTVTVTSDLNGYNDNLLKSETVYDGLGRTIESRQYENATQYILTEQGYDAMGRAAEASNPYRPHQGETAAWTRTEYDARGRVVAVMTPDGAKLRLPITLISAYHPWRCCTWSNERVAASARLNSHPMSTAKSPRSLLSIASDNRF